MKALILSYITAGLVILFVFANSFTVGYNIDRLTEAISSAPDSCDDGGIYQELFEDYERRERFIALTISHSDLLGIEDSFSEILGAVKAKDDESLIIAKSRLIEALAHIKRLAGINFDSIF